jgi:threonine dehydrogenase-like Zn-dependent dehydrogenase
VARILIVGCGCRGLGLAAALTAAGHPVRATTRDPARLAELESAGLEAVVADPYRLATLMPQIANVSAVCWLMGSATGDDVAALHDTRLQTMLERLVDTMVRGLVYEAAGAVDARLLADGAAKVRDARERWHMPTEVVDADPGDHERWVAEMADAVERVLAA